MNTDDTSLKCPSWTGDKPRARDARRAAPEDREKILHAITRLELKLQSVHHKIEMLQEVRADYRSLMVRELDMQAGGEGRWFSLNSALLLLAGTYNNLLRYFHPLFPGLIGILLLVMWIIYIHHQIRREKAARATDLLLRAQIRAQFTLLEKIRCQLIVLNKTSGELPPVL